MNVEWQAILTDASTMDDAFSRERREQDRELEAVVRRHARLVYRISYLLLRNFHDAEDATQETFVRVWRHRERLPEVLDCQAIA